MDFYDEIASEYDAITGAAGRAARAEAFLRELVSRFHVESALDAACGTGLYAIALAKMGVKTLGADISAAMIDQARQNAAQAGVQVDWLCEPMQKLSYKVRERFDAVLCMGNSIPHLLTDADLRAALSGFVELLRPGGVVVVQLLNYERVLAQNERIVGINRGGGKEYVRFYDFLPGRVRFNILEIDWSAGQCAHRLHGTELRPYTADDLAKGLMRQGCSSVDYHSGLSFEAFDPRTDQTVTLIGAKPR